MNIFTSIILGTLQGLTEFLPVSSSGHLVIAQSFIPNFYQPGILFDVVLHSGTLFAILFFYRKKILKITKKYLLLIIIGSIPVVVIGYILQDMIEGFFGNVQIVGIALLITALINYLTDKQKQKTKVSSKRNALFIGLFQAFAIIPGISRSGSTIFAGTYLGFNRKKAAEFSFLLSVPAVIGANVLQFAKSAPSLETPPLLYLAGFASAFISGYLAIGWLLKILMMKKFKYFSVYTFALGVIVLVFSS